ncbi:bacillithiol biosynthesis cysteine-adding enzyme BshC [Fibrella aquatilis]|uniref:Putative cysteine ligase BshC n=1 Tax=Fibrella aquatilis TaxID=2817059 RepID=A0A939K0W0_9BACT|nr:bacillithiol biosynthesis cysteine-adding enzyme BshC [Fibrella aquatilis]MBO0932873.1 bacillithiol biosynthesis cysteine-adding enzyme BshC [Fibrella aquatilis]
MECQYVPLSATGQFSSLFLDYIGSANTGPEATPNPQLRPFYSDYPTIDAFAGQIQKKAFSDVNRAILVDALERQYAHLATETDVPLPDLAQLRNSRTFTVTTGHQLNLCTGPLYVVYKLITTINLARKLAEKYPDYHFVPVYWMASEDHDFAEINHFRLFGKTHTWHTEQRGAVGRMDPRELASLFDQIPEKLALFERAYLTHSTLADAARYYMHSLFGADGLVCIDADDPALKQVFAPIMQDELLQQHTSTLVNATTERLNELGYKTPISPRDINLFYLTGSGTDGLRERIVRTDAGMYEVNGTKLRFSETEILSELASHPERFSPNVVMRPLYQEVILPNLAYIGGPSEVPYWLQLKGEFDYYGIAFPLLMPRNFALYVPKVTAQRVAKLGLDTTDMFQDVVTLKRDYVEHHTEHCLTFDEENTSVNRALETILVKAQLVDTTLEKAVLAETKRFANAVARLEKKMRRAEERNQEIGVRQLLAVKEELFPGGTPQERTDNFLTFFLNDRQFIQKLLHNFDPFTYQMQVCLEG